jgi:hypothetical protein
MALTALHQDRVRLIDRRGGAVRHERGLEADQRWKEIQTLPEGNPRLFGSKSKFFGRKSKLNALVFFAGSSLFKDLRRPPERFCGGPATVMAGLVPANPRDSARPCRSGPFYTYQKTQSFQSFAQAEPRALRRRVDGRDNPQVKSGDGHDAKSGRPRRSQSRGRPGFMVAPSIFVFGSSGCSCK